MNALLRLATVLLLATAAVATLVRWQRADAKLEEVHGRERTPASAVPPSAAGRPSPSTGPGALVASRGSTVAADGVAMPAGEAAAALPAVALLGFVQATGRDPTAWAPPGPGRLVLPAGLPRRGGFAFLIRAQGNADVQRRLAGHFAIAADGGIGLSGLRSDGADLGDADFHFSAGRLHARKQPAGMPALAEEAARWLHLLIVGLGPVDLATGAVRLLGGEEFRLLGCDEQRAVLAAARDGDGEIQASYPAAHARWNDVVLSRRAGSIVAAERLTAHAEGDGRTFQVRRLVAEFHSARP